jgi:hypothetical protein
VAIVLLVASQPMQTIVAMSADSNIRFMLLDYDAKYIKEN